MLIAPLVVYTTAWLAQNSGLGLFNKIKLSEVVVWPLSILLLDFKQYVYHRFLHVFSWMWRFHRVHHTDLDYDLTTGFRFHPFEAIIALTLQIVLVATFGIPPELILQYSLLVYLINFWTHGNFRLTQGVDRIIRLLFVTPYMHRIHHSEDRIESNTNFGALFSFWDRLFTTYLENPQQSHDEMPLGIPEFRKSKKLRLPSLLSMPFR
jgi:sterol desaturase/sphingolipid hydroxylase (fatty acid hydroxylase superfamily)